MYQGPSFSRTSCSSRAVVSSVARTALSISSSSRFGRISLSRRPISAGIRLSNFCADGVKRRMRRSFPTMTTGIHVREQVQQIVVGHGELGITVLQFLVERGQFFIARLQLLLGGLQFFVRALQLLV